MDSPEDEWGDGPGLAESVWRFKGLVALLLVVGATAGYGWSSIEPVRYEAVVRIFLDSHGGEAADAARLVRSRAEFFKSPAVLDRAAELAGDRLGRRDLETRLTVEPSTNADLITIHTQDATPKGAAKLADSVALAYRQVFLAQTQDAAKQTVAELEQTQRRLAVELAQITVQRAARPADVVLKANEDAKIQEIHNVATLKERASGRAAQAAEDTRISEKAAIPDAPAAPKPLRTTALGALFGLVVGAVLAWWLTGRQETARASHRIAAAFDVESPRSRASRPHWRNTLSIPTPRARARSTPSATPADRAASVDVTRLAASVRHVVDSLDDERGHLYREDLPQVVAEAIGEHFHVDLVAVLLQSDEGLDLAGRVGLRTDETYPAERPDSGFLQKLNGGAPRLIGAPEFSDLLRTGRPASAVQAFVAVPLNHEGATFGVVLIGRGAPETPAPAPPLGNGEVEGLGRSLARHRAPDPEAASLGHRDVARMGRFVARHGAPSLYAWLLLRRLQRRLNGLHAPLQPAVPDVH